eukprot:6095756-Pyramimonas_sp.AAC.1
MVSGRCKCKRRCRCKRYVDARCVVQGLVEAIGLDTGKLIHTDEATGKKTEVAEKFADHTAALDKVRRGGQ